MQHAWLADDVEAAATQWSETLGVGPFFVAEYHGKVFESATHRGEPTDLHLKTAITYAGDTQIELVQALGDGSSIYTETADVLPGALHHLCYWSDDFDADLAHYAGIDCPALTLGKMRGGPRFAYLDARAAIGCVIELLERDAGVAAFFESLKAKCEAWDGENAIVHL